MPEIKKKSQEARSASFSIVALLLAMFMWAISFPMLIWALKVIPPITLAMLRYVMLVPLVLVWMHISCGLKNAVKALRENSLLFFLLAMTTVVIPNITQNYGMKLNESSSISSILQSSGPVYTVVLAYIFLKERMGAWQYIGLCLGLLGSMLLATNGFSKLSGGTFTGNILVMISAISYAFSGILGKKALFDHKPSIIISWSIIIGAFVMVPPAIVEHPGALSSNGWLLVIGLALLPSFIAYIFWYAVMEYMPVSRLTITVYIIPIITILLSYFLLGESLSLTSALFAAMIIGGVVAANMKSENKNNRERQGKKST